MGKIVTITFNPCIDKSTTIASLLPEKKLRCSVPKFEPGGGGLNVSRAIKKIGGDSLAIFTSGGHTGHFLEQLTKDECVNFKSVRIQNNTRENLIVLDCSSNQQFRFGMPGPQINDQEWENVLAALEEENDVEFVVASGSLSPGIPLDIYGRIAKIANKKKAKLFVDTSGPALQHAINEGVYLLKPNLSELSSLAGKEEIHAEAVDDVAREIINRGQCEIIVVSMGPAGAILVTKDQDFHVTPPAVKQRSTVGAGDSMVAGIVWALSNGETLVKALELGVACGTAATMNPGTELCKVEDVNKLLGLIRRNNRMPIQ
jgi:6-phosphofructokinase 2